MPHRTTAARALVVAVSLGLAGSVSLFGATAFADPGNSHAATHHTQGTAGTSGSPTSPQPPSNADMAGNGANQSGPYNSTRHGAASLNGNGTGQAVGKPCAGCVGKADNKNPPGQLIVGSAGSGISNGYECNGNHGIGRTNPAHTGCTTSTPTPVPSVSRPPKASPSPQLIRAIEAAPAAVASVASAAVRAMTPGRLPVTGANVIVMLLAGLAAVVLGGLLVRNTRRHVAL